MTWHSKRVSLTKLPKALDQWPPGVALAAVLALVLASPAFALSGLKASADGHFLIQDDGKGTPLVWIGDTAWHISKLKPAGVDRYLQDRARKKFTVIQIMAIRNRGSMENFRGDQSIIVSPIGSRDRIHPAAHAATRSSDNGYVFVYSAQGSPFSVDMTKLSGDHAHAWWYNPRDGKCCDSNGNETALPFGTFDTNGARQFDPPGSVGENNDWVLVLDDPSQGFPPPGTISE